MQTLVERLYENKPLMFAAAIIAFLIAALLLLVIVRMLFGGRLRMPGGRTRQARLGIVDAFDLDRQRQLIIVRRDNTEHLIMIGGPNDLLIESEIIRVEAREQRDARRDKIEGPGAPMPLGASVNEPRIPAPFAPVERLDPSPRSQDIEAAPSGFNLSDQPLPSVLPPPIPASLDLGYGGSGAPQVDPVAPARAPTFPLPPRRPQPTFPERRPSLQSRPSGVRTEPAPPSLEVPPSLSDEVSPPIASTPTPPQVPAPRPAPPPFLRPLPPRTPKILQRTTPSVPIPPPAAAAPLVPPAESVAEPATPPSAPVEPPHPVAPQAPHPAASAPNDTMESLEEEMAKLLGRGPNE
jgi:flagellar protein FliO/FliZ